MEVYSELWVGVKKKTLSTVAPSPIFCKACKPKKLKIFINFPIQNHMMISIYRAHFLFKPTRFFAVIIIADAVSAVLLVQFWLKSQFRDFQNWPHANSLADQTHNPEMAQKWSEKAQKWPRQRIQNPLQKAVWRKFWLNSPEKKIISSLKLLFSFSKACKGVQGVQLTAPLTE